MTHLTPDEVIDAVENSIGAERRRHLISCDQCRAQTAAVASMLREVQTVSAFEPSPLFWDHFSGRVRAAIAAEGGAPSHASRWFEWRVLAPVGALALLVVALVASVPLSDQGDNAVGEEPVITEAEAADSEERWTMMFDLVGEIDLEAVADSGLLGRPGTAERALAQLTSTEQEELVRLLREELRSGG